MTRVTSLDVACPSCGSAPGTPCHSLPRQGVQTVRLSSAHEPRRRRAAEERQQRINPEHVRGQLDLFPAKDAPR